MRTVLINNKTLKNFTAIQGDKSNKPFLNPMNICKTIKLRMSDVVVDIGAYIGEYSVHCINSGVKKVTSYEPTPTTFQVLKLNKLTDRMKIKNMAVVGDNKKTVILNLSKGIGVTNSIVKSACKRTSITVDAIRYEEAVKDATVVKIDVEGAEYDYNIIQPKLRAIIIEFHPIVGVDWKVNAEKIMSDINNAGFKTIKRPEFKNGWDLIGSFLR